MGSTNINVPVGTKARLVTKSDSTDVNCQAVYVGGTGDLAIIAEGDTAAVTLSAIPAGTFVPIACSKIMSTNTTATLIIAIFV